MSPHAELLGVLFLASNLLAQAATRRLEGLVQDPLGQPVANAAVVAEVDGQPLLHTHTDGSGTFLLGRLPAAVVTVRATTTAPEVGAARIDLRDTARAFAVLRVVPARPVRGSTVDAKGQPIAGAFVSSVPLGSAELSPLGVLVQSDAKGHFELPAVPFGRNALRGWAPGCAGFAAIIDGTTATTVVCPLLADDVQERSFVLEDSTPAQRAAARLVVRCVAEEAELPLPPALHTPPLGDDGRWHVDGWPHEDSMLARLELAEAFVEPALLQIAAGAGDRPRQFYLGTGEAIFVRGVLTAASGTKTAGIPLLATGPEGLPRVVATTRDDGSFTLQSPVARGMHFLLQCLDPDFVLRQVRPRDWQPEPQSPARLQCKHSPAVTHEFELLPANTFRCTLRDAEGQPLPLVEVALLSVDRQEVTFAMQGAQPVVRGEAKVFARGHSAADGTVELTGLDLAGQKVLVLQACGRGAFHQQEFPLAGAAVVALGEVRAGPAATLRGRVVAADGSPSPGAWLQVENWNGREHNLLVACDRDGRFALDDLMPGYCRIRRLGERGQGNLVPVEAGNVVEVTIR